MGNWRKAEMERRTEKEMLELILSFAREDSRIRAVWMNGSRANPNAPKDKWQDFDIVYAVSDMAPFLQESSWLDRFGERVVMQSCWEQYDSYDENEALRDQDWFIYMMQFSDGNRIDLNLVPAEKALENALSDRMCVVLLDKDGALGDVPSASDEEYWAKKPSALKFCCAVNEFYWVSAYVAKGLWRGEFSYAQELLDIVRGVILELLSWKAGFLNGFTVNPGKAGKFLPRFLPKEDWVDYLKTYARGDGPDIRRALLDDAWPLFVRLSQELAEAFAYPLDPEEREKVWEYLNRAE